MALSRKEQEDFKPIIDRTVLKFLGFSEPTLTTAATDCLFNGCTQHETKKKLAGLLDDKQASKFTEQLFTALDDHRLLVKLQKNRRKREKATEEESRVEAAAPKKKKRFEETIMVADTAGLPSPGQLNSDKIKEMMANAQRMIEQRKQQLNIQNAPPPPPPPAPAPAPAPVPLDPHVIEGKQRKVAEMQESVQARFANLGLPAVPAAPIIPTKPTPLILDELGRTIDIKTGEAVQLTHHTPTLKANIRAKKREQFRTVAEKPVEESVETKFHDPRMRKKIASRYRRQFKFHETGKFQTLAQRLRTKAQLEKLQNEIASAARKTGIASASRLASIAPKLMGVGEIPQMEWWDTTLTQANDYASLKDEVIDSLRGITHLVEHPTQMQPPAQVPYDVQVQVILTKRERKKLRRQNRMENQKEATEKIRLGLIPPPEPKVRMANLMRVLGTEAVQDPTKVEAHVRAQMAKRQKAHEEANAARKLTKEERREKKARKLQEDVSTGVHVSVYRVNDLTDPSKKFKVETNANQLYMTGIVILHKDCNVVVVEGGPKQQKKFRRLMLHRIKWDEDKRGAKKETEDGKVNTCRLVWEGTVASRGFGEVRFKQCPTETFAREQFRKGNVEHYWDLAYSYSVLEANEDRD
ncbi:hypothetical protein CAPTEDRAFT_19567 [Capitella teleta]|uniref:U4/U6 small nuclear ribonucleoprotein Prp3 n=1 Tax=Capitella teleta TaxID=283909 RepID=R7TZI4_CAPTE|nr:hypothetical protein CAPTEDRAFT_19567 [Capitella teleta]|eukprot:ELT96791.1 hypothetical protein CAPTEDRAFT_19567 [Capitella teleta]